MKNPDPTAESLFDSEAVGGVTLGELAQLVNGLLEGDPRVRITSVAGLREAESGDVTFLARPQYAAAAATTRASAILVAHDFQGPLPCAVIRVDDPDRAFALAAERLSPPPISPPAGIHPTALVSPEAELGHDVALGPYVVVEPGAVIGDRTVLGAGCYIGHDCRIGSDCRFYPHVTLREYTRIGNRVIIHSGAVIGSDGFGYTRRGAGWEKIPQLGIVEIGDDVEIGANVTIDRARFGKTVIGRGAKLDNLIQIAHNVRVGDHTAMAAQAGIAGSTVIGRNVQVGGQAGITGHIRVGDNVMVGAQAGVSKDVPSGAVVWGTPALPLAEMKRLNAHFRWLPEFRRRLEDMKKRLDTLAARIGGTFDGPAGLADETTTQQP